MPLPDGTNAEKEDPVPPLGWTKPSDVQDVKLYGIAASPPCAKIQVFLEYFRVPYEFVKLLPGKGVKNDSSYKKIPVLEASGRTVNDSYIISKSILQACSPNGNFDSDIEEMITFGLQPAIEIECFASNYDMKSYAVEFGLVPSIVPSFIIGLFSPAAGLRKKYPDLKESAEYGRSFRAKLGAQKFYAGDEPGCEDLSYYGTLFCFMKGKCEGAKKHLKDSDLEEWYERMAEKVPPF